jgi:Glycosyltransferase family 87
MVRAFMNSFAGWLTLRRIWAHAIVLAVCLWGVCAVDYATPGMFDRAGNIKFQDFLQFPIAASLLRQARANELYNDQVLADHVRTIVGRETTMQLRYFYGPQVALIFLPLLHFSFLAQAATWVALSLLMYFACVYLVWKTCASLQQHGRLVAIGAIAYPPLFHFFVRGQLSSVILVCVTAANFAFRLRREWLAGLALGLLIFKPQFLVAIPIVLLLARAWRALAGLTLSASAQLGFAYLYFGSSVMRAYVNMVLHSARQPATTELRLSPVQMHSLHSFWEILVPWQGGVWALYLLSSLAVIAMAAAVWKSSSSLAVRYSALILAAVLVNPHIYIYDLLVLAVPLLLLTDWRLNHADHRFAPTVAVLLYLSFLLPLFGPLSRWTHLQLSVPAFVALLAVLWRLSEMRPAVRARELASAESPVV